MNLFLNPILALLCLFLYTSSWSQMINVGHRQIAGDTIGLIGDAELDFDFNNNASTKIDDKTFIGLRAISNISYFTQQHQVFFKNRLGHFRFNGTQFLNRGYSHVRINLFYKRKFGYEIYGQTNFDQVRNLNLRVTSGAGIRYVILNNSTTEFEAGTGLLFEFERWKHPETGVEIDKRLPKSSTYLGFYKHLGHYGVSLLNIFQTGYDDEIEKFRHRMTGFLEFDDFLSDHITLILRIEIHYDDRPVVPNKETTYAISNAIRFRF